MGMMKNKHLSKGSDDKHDLDYITILQNKVERNNNMFEFDKIRLKGLKLITYYYQKNRSDDMTKDDCVKAISLIRTLTIRNIELTDTISSKVQIANRKLRKSNHKHEVEVQINTPFNDVITSLKNERVLYGWYLHNFMNTWQKLGATVDELLIICNISKTYVQENRIDYKNCYKENGFFNMIFTNYLDYKDTDDIIKLNENAPLSIVSREYMITKIGRELSKKTIKKCFPTIVFYNKVITEDGTYIMSDDFTEMIPFD